MKHGRERESAHRTVLVFISLPMFLGDFCLARGDERAILLHSRIESQQILKPFNYTTN